MYRINLYPKKVMPPVQKSTADPFTIITGLVAKVNTTINTYASLMTQVKTAGDILPLICTGLIIKVKTTGPFYQPYLLV